MKNLHKKISVGVLVAGLLVGGGALSSGSVAHASSAEGYIGQELLDKVSGQQKEVLEKIIKLGFRYRFSVVEVNPNPKFLKSNESVIKDNIDFGSYSSFERLIKIMAQSGEYKYSFIQAKVGDLNLVLVFF